MHRGPRASRDGATPAVPQVPGGAHFGNCSLQWELWPRPRVQVGEEGPPQPCRRALAVLVSEGPRSLSAGPRWGLLPGETGTSLTWASGALAPAGAELSRAVPGQVGPRAAATIPGLAQGPRAVGPLLRGPGFRSLPARVAAAGCTPPQHFVLKKHSLRIVCEGWPPDSGDRAHMSLRDAAGPRPGGWAVPSTSHPLRAPWSPTLASGGPAQVTGLHPSHGGAGMPCPVSGTRSHGWGSP